MLVQTVKIGRGTSWQRKGLVRPASATAFRKASARRVATCPAGLGRRRRSFAREPSSGRGIPTRGKFRSEPDVTSLLAPPHRAGPLTPHSSIQACESDGHPASPGMVPASATFGVIRVVHVVHNIARTSLPPGSVRAPLCRQPANGRRESCAVRSVVTVQSVPCLTERGTLLPPNSAPPKGYPGKRRPDDSQLGGPTVLAGLVRLTCVRLTAVRRTAIISRERLHGCSAHLSFSPAPKMREPAFVSRRAICLAGLLFLKTTRAREFRYPPRRRDPQLRSTSTLSQSPPPHAISRSTRDEDSGPPLGINERLKGAGPGQKRTTVLVYQERRTTDPIWQRCRRTIWSLLETSNGRVVAQLDSSLEEITPNCSTRVRFSLRKPQITMRKRGARNVDIDL